MKHSLVLAPALATAILVAGAHPAIAQSPADTQATTTATANQTFTTQQDAERALAQIDARIAQLQAMPAAQANVPAAQAPQVNYGEEIQKLLDTAAELRTTIEALIAGQVPPFDPSTLPARIDLFMTSVDTIQRATTEFTNKVDAAHVELGFCMTRAFIRLLNPTATTAQLTESKGDVMATFAKVAAYPDLQPGDTATIYVKDRLNTKIWQVRLNRDKFLLGQHPEGYRAVNTSLTQAVGVWFNIGATVQQVNDQIQALDATYGRALNPEHLNRTMVQG